MDRSPEFLSQQPEQTESGFSEKRAARIIEGKQTDNSQVAKRKQVLLKQKPLAEKSMSEKMLALYERNVVTLLELTKSLAVMEKGYMRQEEQMLMEIRRVQKIQEELTNAIALERKGLLTKDSLPKELWDLIK